MNFTDIHSHIIPGVDDGSKDIDETRDMLNTAYQNGITTIIATPHVRTNRYKNPYNIKEILKDVQKEASLISPDMKILLGNEFYYTEDYVSVLNSGNFYTLNDSPYILVEMSYSDDLRHIRDGLIKIRYEGKIPILAHVERYTNVVKEGLSALSILRDTGALIQVNAFPVLYPKSFKISRFIKAALKYEMVDFIATDTHNNTYRPPKYLKEAYEKIEAKYGQDLADRIFFENPKLITEYKESKS